MLKVAPCTVVRSYGRTVVRSYGRTVVHPNFFGLMVTTILYNYGATLCELRYDRSHQCQFWLSTSIFTIEPQLLVYSRKPFCWWKALYLPSSLGTNFPVSWLTISTSVADGSSSNRSPVRAGEWGGERGGERGGGVVDLIEEKQRVKHLPVTRLNN